MKISDKRLEKIAKIQERLNRVMERFEEDAKKYGDLVMDMAGKYTEIEQKRSEIAKYCGFMANDIAMARLLQEDIRRVRSELED